MYTCGKTSADGPTIGKPKGPAQKQVYAEWVKNGVKSRQKLVQELFTMNDSFGVLLDHYRSKLAGDKITV